MFKRLFGSTDYSVDENRVIYDLNGQECFRNEKNISYEIFGTTKEVNKKFITLLSWFEVESIKDVEKFLDNFRFFEIKSKQLRLKIGFILTFTEPIYYKEGFRFVPSFSRYTIDIHANVLDTLTNQFVVPLTNYTGYKVVSIYSPDKGRFINYPLHRLLALAWLPNDDYVNRHFINHKDGNKSNCTLENLEWCTHEENVHHALDVGLTSTRVQMKTRDALTGKVCVYKSATELAEKLGMGSVRSSQLLNTLPGYLYKNRYEFKRLDDDSEWFYEKNEYNPKGPKKSFFSINVFNKKDGSESIFRNIRELETYFGIAKKSINTDARIVELKDSHPHLEITYTTNAVLGPYCILNLLTNETITKNSIVESARYIGRGKSEIQMDLSRDNKFIYDKKWIIHPVSRKLKLEEYTFKKSIVRKIEVINQKDGTVKIYSSMRETSKELGYDFKSIVSAVRKGTIYHGLKFRALDE